MDIKLYNTLSKKVETFKPIKKDQVQMYTCGPTVYDAPHLGNYRTYVLSDLVRRVFEYNNVKVNDAMNITDIDDKTIKRSQEQKITLNQLTSKYEQIFFDELEQLNIKKPANVLRATENISEMIELISKLLDKGIAYVADDGIYLSISKVNNYGELASLNLDTAKSKSRIQSDEYDKTDPRDFALWKFKAKTDGEVEFSAPFGNGRPGWHIECSAMSIRALGETFDVHVGGSDLIFPHHTNEIAQSESATGKHFVNYWIHGGFMNVFEEKMSKSKGNTLKLADLAAEAISPLGFKYWLYTAHYRSPINFTLDGVKGAQNALIGLMQKIANYPEPNAPIIEFTEKFNLLINNDLDMPKAIALIWELVNSQDADADKHATLLNFDKVLGLKLGSVPKAEKVQIPPEIQALIDAREAARQESDFQKADALRAEIESRGFTIKDTAVGTEVEVKP